MTCAFVKILTIEIISNYQSSTAICILQYFILDTSHKLKEKAINSTKIGHFNHTSCCIDCK